MTNAQTQVRGSMICDNWRRKRHASICNKIKDGSIKLEIKDDFLEVTYKDVFIDTIFLNAEDHEHKVRDCLGMLHQILSHFSLVKF